MEETLIAGLKNRQEFARWTSRDIPGTEPKRVQIMAREADISGKHQSLIVECAVVRVGGTGSGTDTEVLVCPARTLELILRATGVLEEFRQENSMVLFVFL